VESPLRTAFGVTASPRRGIDSKDQGPALRTVVDQEASQRVSVDRSTLQHLVETAVAATELGLQAQRGHRPDRCRRTQCGVGQLEKRISPVGEAGTQLCSEVDQLSPLSFLISGAIEGRWSGHDRLYVYYRTRTLGYWPGAHDDQGHRRMPQALRAPLSRTGTRAGRHRLHCRGQRGTSLQPMWQGQLPMPWRPATPPW
jgi:hypothetical protein